MNLLSTSKLLLFAMLLTGLHTRSFGQSPQEGKAFQDCYRPDIPATFPGGWPAFLTFIADNKIYPREAKKQQIRGTVLIDFMLDTLGNVRKESIQVTQSVHPILDQEAIRIIKKSPPWNPGRISQLNKAVEAGISVPIHFGE